MVAFALCSRLAGGAHHTAMLIVGRIIRGVGAGGILVLLNILCSILSRHRNVGSTCSIFPWSVVAAALCSPVRGALVDVNCLCIFYMHLPICGVALGELLLFMQVRSCATDARISGIMAKLGRLDIVGSLFFTLNMIFLLIGLVGGSTQHL
jgi:MFS family permease